MRVENVMTSLVGTCRPFDSLHQAAQIMWEQDCGAVPVVDHDGRVLAMLTDRDICMAAYTQGRALTEIRVSSAMSRDLFQCHPDEDVGAAEERMRQHQVRRLPVVDVEGTLLGILSLSDLAREAMAEKKAKLRKKPVKLADVGETLGAISGAPGPPS